MSLDGAVLSVRAVQHGKDDIKALPRRRGPLQIGRLRRGHQAGLLRVGPESGRDEIGGRRLRCTPSFRAARGSRPDKPSPVLGDPDGDHFVFSGSRAHMIDSADMRLTSCSPLRPPNRTATRIFRDNQAPSKLRPQRLLPDPLRRPALRAGKKQRQDSDPLINPLAVAKHGRCGLRALS